jgi:hypothetical protein
LIAMYGGIVQHTPDNATTHWICIDHPHHAVNTPRGVLASGRAVSHTWVEASVRLNTRLSEDSFSV